MDCLKSNGIILYMFNLSRFDTMQEKFKDIGLALIVGLALAVLALEYFDILTK